MSGFCFVCGERDTSVLTPSALTVVEDTVPKQDPGVG